jgi:hypothetical protein
MHSRGANLCLFMFIAIAARAAQSAEPTGFFSEPVGLNIDTDSSAFDCSLISLFRPTFSDLPFNISVDPYMPPTLCHNSSESVLATTGGCLWLPQTFLGILYDRGVEMLRHNIPQRDAFQVYV